MKAIRSINHSASAGHRTQLPTSRLSEKERIDPLLETLEEWPEEAAGLKVGSAFCEGWREKTFVEMTEAEIATWFGEMTLLVSADGEVQ